MDQALTKFWNLPNILTGARIVAIPVVMVLLCFKGELASFLGA